jgi:methenyltetrahydrofolate cyclohydrolase
VDSAIDHAWVKVVRTSDEDNPSMKPSVWESTLEQFRNQVASRQPVPASACVSAVSACLALNLLVKVLEITVNKKGFSGDPGRIETLLDAAKTLSARLARYADEDVAAFNAYLKSAKLPKSHDEEREKRKRAMAAALQQVISVPFEAARSAASGTELCADAIGLVPNSLIADLGAAVTLLAGAVRGLMVSTESNIRQLADDQEHYHQIAAQLEDLEREVLKRENSVRRKVASIIAGEDQ